MNRLAALLILPSCMLAVVLSMQPITASAASQHTGGDGSGIGGTGNNPGGGGIGGTGTREQSIPDTMPDLPERPEVVDTPSVEIPDPPVIDSGATDGIVSPPDSLPEPLPPAGE